MLKRYLVALSGAVLATFAAASIALAGEPVGCEQPNLWTYERSCGPDKGPDVSSGDATGGDVTQQADQDNDTYQDADAHAGAIQVGGLNLALNVLSSGDTEQANSNENSAEAENSNGTVQVIDQDQIAAGGDASSGDAASGTSPTVDSKSKGFDPCASKCGGSGDASTGDARGGDVEQDADQDNDTDQDADATAKAIQIGGANLAVNVLSSGDTKQANRNENEAEASNSNKTIQVIDQDQLAGGGNAASGDAWSGGGRGADASSGDASGGDVEQDADQDNDTDQVANADAYAFQLGGANLAANVLNGGIRSTKCGGCDGGSGTSQWNSNENEAEAENSNRTFQVVDQGQLARGGDATSGDASADGSGDSYAGRSGTFDGKGRSGSDASTGDARGGDVEQDADQDNDTDQDADATAKAIQVGGVNLAANVLSSGDTRQGNSNENSAKADNSNGTVQLIGQDQVARGGDATSGSASASGGDDASGDDDGWHDGPDPKGACSGGYLAP